MTYRRNDCCIRIFYIVDIRWFPVGTCLEDSDGSVGADCDEFPTIGRICAECRARGVYTTLGSNGNWMKLVASRAGRMRSVCPPPGAMIVFLAYNISRGDLPKALQRVKWFGRRVRVALIDSIKILHQANPEMD